MTVDEIIKRYTDNAEYERTHGNLQGCLDFRQLAEWLKELKQLREQQPCDDCISREEVLIKLLIDAYNIGYKDGVEAYKAMMELEEEKDDN